MYLEYELSLALQVHGGIGWTEHTWGGECIHIEFVIPSHKIQDNNDFHGICIVLGIKSNPDGLERWLSG